MLKSIKKRYAEGKASWDNKDGYVQPVIPYWAFLCIMSTPFMLLGFMVYQIATR